MSTNLNINQCYDYSKRKLYLLQECLAETVEAHSDPKAHLSVSLFFNSKIFFDKVYAQTLTAK